MSIEFDMNYVTFQLLAWENIKNQISIIKILLCTFCGIAAGRQEAGGQVWGHGKSSGFSRSSRWTYQAAARQRWQGQWHRAKSESFEDTKENRQGFREHGKATGTEHGDCNSRRTDQSATLSSGEKNILSIDGTQKTSNTTWQGKRTCFGEASSKYQFINLNL